MLADCAHCSRPFLDLGQTLASSADVNCLPRRGAARVIIGYHSHVEATPCGGAHGTPATFFGDRHSGLVDQLELLSHGLAHACLQNASLVSGPFFPSLLSADMVSWAEMLSMSETSTMLQSLRACRHTRLLPPHCLHDERLRQSAVVSCPISVRAERGVKNELAGDILARLVVGENQLRHWVPTKPLHVSQIFSTTAKSTPRPPDYEFRLEAPFNAVHLNLDCDWLLFAVNRSLYKEWRQSEGEDRARLSEACQRGAHPGVTGFAIGAIDLVATHTLLRLVDNPTWPIVIATAIGKPGHEATQWVLDEFVARLSDRLSDAGTKPAPHLVVGASNMSQRELNAAAELRVVQRARNFVAWYESSFSMAASAAVAARGGRVSLVEWWDALTTPKALKKVLQEVCAAGPHLASVTRACARHRLETPEPTGLNHLSLRAYGESLDELLPAACAKVGDVRLRYSIGCSYSATARVG